MIAAADDKREIGFVDDKPGTGTAAAHIGQFRPRNQVGGGIVGIADKHGVGPAGGIGELCHIGYKVPGCIGREIRKRDVVHPAGVGIIGIGGGHNQHPPTIQGRREGMDQLGGAVAGNYLIR